MEHPDVAAPQCKHPTWRPSPTIPQLVATAPVQAAALTQSHELASPVQPAGMGVHEAVLLPSVSLTRQKSPPEHAGEHGETSPGGDDDPLPLDEEDDDALDPPPVQKPAAAYVLSDSSQAAPVPSLTTVSQAAGSWLAGRLGQQEASAAHPALVLLELLLHAAWATSSRGSTEPASAFQNIMISAYPGSVASVTSSERTTPRYTRRTTSYKVPSRTTLRPPLLGEHITVTGPAHRAACAGQAGGS